MMGVGEMCQMLIGSVLHPLFKYEMFNMLLIASSQSSQSQPARALRNTMHRRAAAYVEVQHRLCHKPSYVLQQV
jgi:hypothetical protein